MGTASFRHLHRVNYDDCTVGNHIYYARYLEIIEHARNEFFRHIGTTFLQWQEQDTIFPVVESHLKYRAPARFDEMLEVEVRVERAQRASLEFGYRITRPPDTLILEGRTLHVCTGLDEKPKRLPAGLVERLRAYVETG